MIPRRCIVVGSSRPGSCRWLSLVCHSIRLRLRSVFHRISFYLSELWIPLALTRLQFESLNKGEIKPDEYSTFVEVELTALGYLQKCEAGILLKSSRIQRWQAIWKHLSTTPKAVCSIDSVSLPFASCMRLVLSASPASKKVCSIDSAEAFWICRSPQFRPRAEGIRFEKLYCSVF